MDLGLVYTCSTLDSYLDRGGDTFGRAGWVRAYGLGGGLRGKDVDHIGVRGAAEPIACPAKRERVDHAVLIPPAYFME